MTLNSLPSLDVLQHFAPHCTPRARSSISQGSVGTIYSASSLLLCNILGKPRNPLSVEALARAFDNFLGQQAPLPTEPALTSLAEERERVGYRLGPFQMPAGYPVPNDLIRIVEGARKRGSSWCIERRVLGSISQLLSGPTPDQLLAVSCGGWTVHVIRRLPNDTLPWVKAVA